jgi:hypothetical protein
MAARLGLPGVGKASTRGLHQPAGRLEIITFQAIEVPAEALHLSLGSWVQCHKELHNRNQLDL